LAELGDPDGELSILFTGDREMRELNRQFRKRDSVTDVLSFSPGPVDSDVAVGVADIGVLGDIAISLQQAKKQAKRIGNSFEREVLFLAVHGLLHLLGYSHDGSVKEERKMIEMQKKLMKAGYRA
jgi:probable rRNA maturation factor